MFLLLCLALRYFSLYFSACSSTDASAFLCSISLYLCSAISCLPWVSSAITCSNFSSKSLSVASFCAFVLASYSLRLAQISWLSCSSLSALSFSWLNSLIDLASANCEVSNLSTFSSSYPIRFCIFSHSISNPFLSSSIFVISLSVDSFTVLISPIS